MMKGQARLSVGIMGFDTHMILEPCLLRMPSSEPDTRSLTSHHATMPRPCIRDRLEAQLTALDTKESNLLDLAADGDLPKEKIREKLIAIRNERAGIRRDIDRRDAELETGRQVFLLALDLLDQPQELYRQAGPALRKMLNQTIFTKLMLDGSSVVTDELAEPFDVIVPARRAYDEQSYYRKRPPAITGVVLHEGVSADDLTLIDLLQLAQGAMVAVSRSWWS